MIDAVCDGRNKLMSDLNREAGYADLVPLRIIATVVFVLSLVAIPAYLDHVNLNKLMPVLNDLQQGVESHYKMTKQLPDLAELLMHSGNGDVDAHGDQIRVHLAFVEERLSDKYLLLQPRLEKEGVAWECRLSGDLYSDDIPVMGKGVCQTESLSLLERSLWERSLNITERIWKVILGYLLFIVFTFIVG